MAGHLFISRGNLLELACDAILIPTGSGALGDGEVRPLWRDKRLNVSNGYVSPAPSELVRVREAAPYLSPQDPALWVGHTGAAGKEPEWYAKAASAFVREAAAPNAAPAPGAPRPLGEQRPLVALPLIGTGQGGMERRKGEVVAAVVGAIREAQVTTDADVVLVLATPEAYAAAQKAREALGAVCWEDLSEYHRAEGRRLAKLVRAGRLVLFLGAGASTGAGLPSWDVLLAKLAERADLTAKERVALKQMDPRDGGAILARRLEQAGTSLSTAICKLTRAERSSLVHQLLASLPVHEAVTTNYDTLFESAWVAAGRHPSVLPRQDARDATTWLLKLHGSVDDPERIVLSREDYLRFEGDATASSGVVQAMLLTRHMLFVGYSMSDDNFHRIVHQVRRGIGPLDQRPDARSFGTALIPQPAGLSQELWTDDVDFVSTARGDELDVRRLAILLDLIAAEAAAPAAHMLDDAYVSLLSEPERRLRDRLLAVWDELDAGRSDLGRPLTDAIAEALGRIGRP